MGSDECDDLGHYLTVDGGVTDLTWETKAKSPETGQGLTNNICTV